MLRGMHLPCSEICYQELSKWSIYVLTTRAEPVPNTDQFKLLGLLEYLFIVSRPSTKCLSDEAKLIRCYLIRDSTSTHCK